MKMKISFLRNLFLSFFFLGNALLSHGQNQETRDALEIISTITGSSVNDNTDLLLKETGFDVPERLKKEWNNFPAYRKIEIAYWNAEINKNGRKFIALLSNKLHKEYESVAYEKALKGFLQVKINPAQHLFALESVSLAAVPKVPRNIANSILAIVKYTDSRALGGTTNILKFHFGLSDEVTIEILRKSSNNYDALIMGIDKASIPPTQKVRLKEIALELRENFESASMDEKLAKIIEEPKRVKAKTGVALTQKPPTEKLKKDYQTFFDKTHPTKESKRFKKMKTNPDGFGGVIFGNKISTEKNAPKLINVVWIHKNSNREFISTGTLEFMFSDSSVKTMQGVLWEDVYAAYNIVYLDSKSIILDKDRGIGLTGADYPDVYNEDRMYDSIIRSNNLSANEIEYYLFRCESIKSIKALNKKVEAYISMSPWKKKIDSLNNKIDFSINKLDNLGGKIKKNDSLLIKQVQLREKAIMDFNLTALDNSRSKIKSLILQYKIDSAAYSKVFNVYKTDRTNLAMLSQKASIELLNKFSKEYNEYNEYKKQDSLWKMKDSVAVENIEYYISSTNKIILHPAVANLELGRALIRADVLPRSGLVLIDKMEADTTIIELCKKWLKDSDRIGWKFTDDSLLISTKGKYIRITRESASDNAETQLGLLNFNKIDTKDGKTTSTDFPEFKSILPALRKTFYDFNRLNSFAKTLTVVRWSNQSGAKFWNKPKTPPLYKAPVYSIVKKDGSVELIDMKE